MPEATSPGLGPVEADYPGSRKVYLEADGLRVPMREIHLAAGEPPLLVYDTTGPQGAEVGQGLPRLREPWVKRRLGRGDRNLSQLHCARRDEITEEMRFVALREGISP